MTLASSPSTTLKLRRTRIVATVGPASREPATLQQLIQAGVNVFRLNFSHGTHEEHRQTYQRIRAAASEIHEPIAILVDLCGPKIRVGRFEDGRITLTPGERVIVTTRDVLGRPGLIPTQYSRLTSDLRPGDRILMDDGLLELRVDSVVETDAVCVVVTGGILCDRKGMNLPGVAVSVPSLTEKDREDARFALELGADWLALSFVRRRADVEELRTLIAEAGRNTPVVAKIETPEAVRELDSILESAGAIMVARGDLGVELAPEAVPIVQQELVARARSRGKPVIVATQMLESMVHNPRPTRAEVSDVSQAVFSGTDAVMLSAETAAGDYPVEAVRMMDRVARQIESWQWEHGAFHTLTRESEHEWNPPLPLRTAVARCLAQLSRDLRVRAIVVRTRTGTSAAITAATRPAAPVLALTTDPAVCRRLVLTWGVIPREIDDVDFAQPQNAARRLVLELGLASPGEFILLLAGFGKNEPRIIVLPV